MVVNGVKIDVEGAEALVVAGMKEVIKKYSPWVLLDFQGHLMDKEMRMKNWKSITSSARTITFICTYDGTLPRNSDKLRSGGIKSFSMDTMTKHLRVAFRIATTLPHYLNIGSSRDSSRPKKIIAFARPNPMRPLIENTL